MESTISSLYVTLGLRANDFNNGLRQAQRELKAMEDHVRPTTKLMGALADQARSAGTALTVAFTAPIAAIAGIGLQFNAMREQAEIAFTTMLGSGAKAQVFLDDLQDFAAKTPFEFPDLVKASQRLMAMGIAAERVRPVLTAVGDASAAMGGGADMIEHVTRAFGQINATGHVNAREMMELTMAGIPAWDILAKKIGVDVPTAMKLSEKGAIDSATAIAALTSGIEERFGGMMDKQSRTFSGLISTIKDESRFVAGDLTKGLFEFIKGPLESLTNGLHGIRTEIARMAPESKGVIAVAVGGLAAIGPLLLGISVGISAIKQGMIAIAALQAGFFAVATAMAGVGKIGSLAELALAIELYGGLAAAAQAFAVALLTIAGPVALLGTLAYELYQIYSIMMDIVTAQGQLDLAGAEQGRLKAGTGADYRGLTPGQAREKAIKEKQAGAPPRSLAAFQSAAGKQTTPPLAGFSQPNPAAFNPGASDLKFLRNDGGNKNLLLPGRTGGGTGGGGGGSSSGGGCSCTNNNLTVNVTANGAGANEIAQTVLNAIRLNKNGFVSEFHEGMARHNVITEQ